MYGMAVDNLVSQFAARFQPGGEDHLYFPPDGSGGIPCSYDEALDLSRDYDRAIRRAARLTFFGVLLLGAGLGVAEGLDLISTTPLQQALVLLVPTPLFFAAWRRASDMPAARFAGRAVAAPPLADHEARRIRLDALPDSALGLIVIVNALLAFSAFRDGVQRSDSLYAIIIAASVMMIIAILGARRR